MDFLIDAFMDTGRIVPLLAMIYFLVAFLEYRYGGRMGHFIMRFTVFGPVVGAFFGCLPQCGFAVMAAALYVKRFISIGTLLAVFLSTSDEAVPVLLSMPERLPMVGTLIALKFAIAVIAGIAIDLLLAGRGVKHSENDAELDREYHEVSDEHRGCCSHELSDGPARAKVLFLHPLLHTVKIFIFLFVLSAALNFILGKIGEERAGAMFLNGTLLQPVLASAVGLIPNCFASVLLAQFYAQGAISFGSLVAGLCTGAGLGILVLVKENKDFKDTLKVIGLLLGVSIAAGILVQAVGIAG